jgi:hypothetical protein
MPPGRRGRGKVAPLLIILVPDGEINARELKAVLSWSGGQDARNTRKKPSRGFLHIPPKRYIPEHCSVVAVGTEDGSLRYRYTLALERP